MWRRLHSLNRGVVPDVAAAQSEWVRFGAWRSAPDRLVTQLLSGPPSHALHHLISENKIFSPSSLQRDTSLTQRHAEGVAPRLRPTMVPHCP